VKILFVDDHAGLQEKWVEPLRGEGWGVVRTRSTQDAEKVFEFHGDSIDVMIVSESNSNWAGQWGIPYLVLKTTWKDIQVMKHQSSVEQPAFAYLDFDSQFEFFKQSVMDAKGKPVKKQLKSTGTESVSAIESVAPSTTSASHEDSSSEGGIVIQLENYTSAEKPVIESTSLAPKSSPPVQVAIENKEDPEKTRMISGSGMEANADDEVLQFINQDFDEAGVADSVPHESLSAAVQELGGEALPKREATRHIEVMNDADATTVQKTAELPFEPGFDEAEDLSYESTDQDLSVDPIMEVQADFSNDPILTQPRLPVDKDLETMKNYLALREQDVMVLTGQMRSAQERVKQLEDLLRVERSRGAELNQMVQKQDQQIKSFERDKQVEHEVMLNQIEDLNDQLREKNDKVRAIETKLRITSEEVGQVKDRVRVDIRRIRVREKELENQLEILKKDSAALLLARDEKVLELKRKIDLLEFNMELVQEQYNKERNVSEQLRQKLKDAAGVMKRAGGLLDHEN
jgi:hypothetical protein